MHILDNHVNFCLQMTHIQCPKHKEFVIYCSDDTNTHMVDSPLIVQTCHLPVDATVIWKTVQILLLLSKNWFISFLLKKCGLRFIIVLLMLCYVSHVIFETTKHTI